MYLDVYGRQWQGRFPFTHSGIQENVPADTNGVYMVLSGRDEQALQEAYIGIATKHNSIRARLFSHLRGGGNWGLGRRQRPELYSFVFFPCDDLTAAQIEGYVVTNRKPPFNVRPESVYFLSDHDQQWYCVSSITVH
ncbi:MAG TPA: hypothetical protein VLV88_09560 [Terriglobales bacterium]|nr:hypothetical protein [Terriglobales bacterium]